MNFSKNKSITCLFLVFSFVIPFSLQAKVTEDQFVAKCMQLATASKRSGPTFTCTANSSKDGDLLRSIGVDDSFEIEASKARVGSWGDGTSNYFGEVAFVVKRGLFGAKVMRVSCIETAKGNIELRDSVIKVDIENHIDSMTTAKVTCR